MFIGCDVVVIFSLKGQIGQDEKILLIMVIVFMLLVVILVIIMILMFVWKYCVFNIKVCYELKWFYLMVIEVVVWLILCMIVLVLVVLIWCLLYVLDLYCLLDLDVKLVIIEVILLDWKWLFIYLEEKVVVVNEIKFLVNMLLNFKIMFDLVMNVFFILYLGSMIYLMVVMEIKFYLIVNEIGEFLGMFLYYSGVGFVKMYFIVYLVIDVEYCQWLDQVCVGEQILDKVLFKVLGEVCNVEWYLVIYFGKIEEGLFDWVIVKYMGDNKYYGMKYLYVGVVVVDVVIYEVYEGYVLSDVYDFKELGENLDVIEYEYVGYVGYVGLGE